MSSTQTVAQVTNYETENTVEVAPADSGKPSTMSEIAQKLKDVKEFISSQQHGLNMTKTKMRDLEKLLEKHAKENARSNKRGRRQKRLSVAEGGVPRKPCGFQIPTSISDELCDFIGCAKGVCIPRTEITKFMSKYIRENSLQDPQQKKFIIPDAKLAALLGPDAVGVPMTHFVMQRFLKRHFPPSKKDLAPMDAPKVA